MKPSDRDHVEQLVLGLLLVFVGSFVASCGYQLLAEARFRRRHTVAVTVSPGAPDPAPAPEPKPAPRATTTRRKEGTS